MTTGPASPARQAREALGARLREIRKEAGLTGRALAAAIGWHHTKVSRVETGGQTPSEGYIRAWCRVCDAEDQVPDLIAILAVMSLPRVSLGIIPASAPHRTFASVGFWIYDEAVVGVETPTASLEVTQPREIRLYAKMFEQLRSAAVYGPDARTLVNQAIADLATVRG